MLRQCACRQVFAKVLTRLQAFLVVIITKPYLFSKSVGSIYNLGDPLIAVTGYQLQVASYYAKSIVEKQLIPGSEKSYNIVNIFFGKSSGE